MNINSISERDRYETYIMEVAKTFDKIQFDIQNIMIDLYVRELNHSKVAKRNAVMQDHQCIKLSIMQ